MQKTVLFPVMSVLTAWSSLVGAEEVGRVISSTPVIQQVAVPRQVCSNQPVVVQQPNSGAGAVMGGIAGGAVGNAIGQGSGRAVATVLGIIGGAALGNHIEGSGSQMQNVQQCSTQTFYESRTVAYNVKYEYAGKEFSVQMPNDPGPAIRLQVTPIAGNTAQSGAGASASSAAQPVIVAPAVNQPIQASPQPQTSGQAIGQVIAVAPAPVVYSYPTYYPAYYGSPFLYPPIGVSLNFGFSSGFHHHHWR